jgi:pyridoxal phosphate-dependent aminotransferase EpsN
MGADELELVKEAFATNWIAPLGPHVDAFEKEFSTLIRDQMSVTRPAGAGEIGHYESRLAPPPLHAAALSSGTSALHLALRLLGLQSDDEVFVSTLTFSASVNPIVYERGRPVFIDSERTSWNMDPARLEEAFDVRARKGRLPKAVVLVHLYGQTADIDAIAGLCEKYGVPLIEDAAEALGAVYWDAKRPLSAQRASLSEPTPNNESRVSNNDASSGGIAPGTRGRMGIFSFNGNKIITTSGGGMLVSPDEGLIKKAKFLATQARDPAPHYQHSEIGFNYRLSNVCAAIGRGQLRVLADRVEARRENCAFYQAAFADLPGMEFMPEAPWNRCTRWLTCVLIDPAKFGVDRETVRLALEAENIEARPVWKPMHLQPVFAGCESFGGAVAEDLFNRGLCLPSGSNLSETDLQRVVDVVRKCRKG